MAERLANAPDIGRNITRLKPGDVHRGNSALVARHQGRVERGCVQPHGGGVALRLSIRNTCAWRNTRARERARHESGHDGPVRLASDRAAPRLYDAHSTKAALLTDTVPTAVMFHFPQSACGLIVQRSAFRIAAIRSCSIDRQRVGNGTRRNSLRFRTQLDAQAKNNCSQPPMSVKRNLFTDRAPGNSVRKEKKSHAAELGNENSGSCNRERLRYLAVRARGLEESVNNSLMCR